MGDTQYDVSEKFLKLFQKKQEQRNKTKAYFAKYMQNPHRPVGESKLVSIPKIKLKLHFYYLWTYTCYTNYNNFQFDSGLFRYSAMQAYQIEYFKPKTGTFILSWATILVPIAGLTYFFTYQQRKKEELLRSGLVAYKDRSFRTIL